VKDAERKERLCRQDFFLKPTSLVFTDSGINDSIFFSVGKMVFLESIILDMMI